MESGPRAMSILRLQNRRHFRGAARRLGCTAGTCETRWSFDWLILFILMKVFTCSIVAVLLGLLALKTFVIGYYRIPQMGCIPHYPLAVFYSRLSMLIEMYPGLNVATLLCSCANRTGDGTIISGELSACRETKYKRLANH